MKNMLEAELQKVVEKYMTLNAEKKKMFLAFLNDLEEETRSV